MTSAPPMAGTDMPARAVALGEGSAKLGARGRECLPETRLVAWLQERGGEECFRRQCAAWAGAGLGVEGALLLDLDANLARTLASRLSESAHGAQAVARVVGWRLDLPIEPPTGRDWLVAWPRLWPLAQLPAVVVDARAGSELDFGPTLRRADALAEAGWPLVLLLEAPVWRAFLRGAQWDRAATRWKEARVYGEPPPRAVELGRSTDYLAHQAPEALPMLKKLGSELSALPSGTPPAESAENRARSAAEALLFSVLEARPSTRGQFRLNARLPFQFGRREAEADLSSAPCRLVVEIDGYYHFQDPGAYRRDRRKDALFQEQGWFVRRFLAEDVAVDLENIITEIERIMNSRLNGN